jgi:hypothetical protein
MCVGFGILIECPVPGRLDISVYQKGVVMRVTGKEARSVSQTAGLLGWAGDKG